MANVNFIQTALHRYVECGFRAPENIIPTYQLQQIIFQKFEEFWSIPDNRIGNEKNGFYEKEIQTEEGKIHLKIPRDKKNKFKCEYIIKYLKYSEHLIYSIISLSLIKGNSVSSIIQHFENKNIKVSREIINQIKDTWADYSEKLYEMTYVPENIKYLYADGTYAKTNSFIYNKYDEQEQSYYYINNKGEKKFTKKSRFTVTQSVCTLRTFGKTTENNLVASVDFKTASSESVPNYVRHFNSIKSKYNIDPYIVCTDGNAAVQRAVQIVFPNSRHQLCLVHLEREIKKEVQKIEDDDVRKHDLEIIKEMFKEIKKADSRYLAEDIVNTAIDNLVESGDLIRTKILQQSDSVFAFLEVPDGQEKISYTTNCVESHNKIFKSFLKNKGSFYGIDSIKSILNVLHFLCNIKF